MRKRKSRTLEIVLIKDVEGLGREGEIKVVKPGYFLNFLLPQKLAIIASEKIKQSIIKEEEEKKIKKEKFQKALSIFKNSLPNPLLIKAKCNPKGILYKKIDSNDILKKLKGEKYIKKILLKEPLKKIGSYSIKIVFKDNEEINVKIIVDNVE